MERMGKKLLGKFPTSSWICLQKPGLRQALCTVWWRKACLLGVGHSSFHVSQGFSAKKWRSWLSRMCRNSTTWQKPMGGCGTASWSGEKRAFCPPTPRIYWKAKGITMPPMPSPPHSHTSEQRLLPVPIWSSSKEPHCFCNPIHAIAATLTHVWVCKLLGQRMPTRRRPSMRVRSAGSW